MSHQPPSRMLWASCLSPFAGKQENVPAGRSPHFLGMLSRMFFLGWFPLQAAIMFSSHTRSVGGASPRNCLRDLWDGCGLESSERREQECLWAKSGFVSIRHSQMLHPVGLGFGFSCSPTSQALEAAKSVDRCYHRGR